MLRTSGQNPAGLWNSTVKLPNADRAMVDIAKLRDYCLSMQHPVGKHKAKVFVSALGITANDAGELQAALLRAARSVEALPTDQDQYGQRYVVDFTMTRGTRTARIRSAWIVRTDDDYPRLTTCYVL